MKVELTEENFCKIIDRIEEYWRTVQELEEKYSIDIWESVSSRLADAIQDFLSKIIYGVDEKDMDDINYYMWELDFGRKWKTGMVIINGIDTPLRSSEDLWNILNEK